ncbi:MAG: hypothetical protein AAF591_17770 [Verrucomicrobiota bacterium]
MKEVSQSLMFNYTTLSVVAGVVFVLVMVWLSIRAWHRSGYRRSIGLLELLRVVIAVGIAITLNQPEWREIFEPEAKPVLAVVWDESLSMETRDIVDGDDPGAEPRSRAELAGPLAKKETWVSLEERMDVAVESFSSQGERPREGTDLNGALAGVMEKYPRLRAVVLVTDGDWNAGSAPVEAATRLRMRETPVFAVPVGAETRLPDVELVSFDVPTFGVAGKPLRIPFTIDSSLPRDETVVVEMEASSGEVLSKQVTLPAMNRYQDALVWRPERPGEFDLKLSIPKTGSERYEDNNVMEAPVSIRKERLRVLVVESYPRWEYRYLRNALERDPGVEVNCLLFHPELDETGAGRGYLPVFPKDEDLAKYDVVFLGDVGVGNGQLTDEQCDSLRKLVRDQAAGLVFMPGWKGNQGSLQGTALAELVPVIWDHAQPRGWGSSAPGRFALTEAGMRSLLTKLEDSDEASARVWAGLPGFQWYAPAVRAKAGTEILATHGSETNRFGRIPLIVTKTFGSGKILFMGTDGAWRWRKGVEDKYHYRFWGQVVRWMAYQRNMSQGDNIRLFYSPDRPRSGDVLTLNVNAISPTGEPLREGTVIAQIASPSGKTSSVRLNPPGAEAWGLFTGVFTPDEAGEHRVQVSCREAGTALDSVIMVQGVSRERRGRAARWDVLGEIAQLTRGEVLGSADPVEVVGAVAAMAEPDPQERRLQLWAHPAWAGILIVFMGVFWAGRKAAGAF